MTKIKIAHYLCYHHISQNTKLNLEAVYRSRSNNNTSSNLVQIPPSTGSDLPATLGVHLNKVHVLQLLKNVASNGTTALAEMRWATAIPLTSTINPLECTNTESTPQVDLPCNGSSSDIVPVRIIRCQLLKPCSLHNIGPFWKLHLARSFEMSRVSFDKLV
uniref:Uncharacterized protein n=1 Tax=Medicago truncatula TaxID=3880 RepID=I3SF18_MEDTR|nr:unknown [Medicago truncatula]